MRVVLRVLAMHFRPKFETFFVSAAIVLLSSAAADAAPALRYSSAPNTRERRVTLRRDGDRVVIVNDATGDVVASSSASATRRVVVQGLEGSHTDTLTVDLRRGLTLPDGVEFDAGVAGFDTLNIVHDPARLVRFDYE